MNSIDKKRAKRVNPWIWLPSLYFAEGLPYVIVMTLSVIMYKRMGISNADIALYTSWLYLPWVIKPFWSPIVDLLRTKRFWIVIMQLIIGAGLAGVALTIPVPNFFQYTLAFFWLLAFSSATNDIASDGFYMHGLDEGQQAFFVGIRSTFYRIAMLTGQGLIVIVAGYLEASTGLGAQDVTATSVRGASISQEFSPGNVEISPSEGDLKIICTNDIRIGTDKISRAKADSLIGIVKTHNIQHGFYENEVRHQSEQSASWWTQNISDPLKTTLKKWFVTPELKSESGMTGNVGLVHFYLTGPPEHGEEIIVHLAKKSGDKDIKLVEGGRYLFDDHNWNVPAYAVLALDPKLDRANNTVFELRSGNISLAWSISFGILALLFLVFFIYHRFSLPYPRSDEQSKDISLNNILREFGLTFVAFFRKKQIGVILAFLLVYRLGESQLVKMAAPFLLDSRNVGGLGLTTGDLGLVYGTIGMIALTVGGILGGLVASQKGLKYWLWWMIIAMNLPNLVYVFLSFIKPDSFYIISASVAVEQFGYGFGFTAYMLYMIYISEEKYKTAHFAIATGFMALGMMIPGMISGWLQEIIGYQKFFIWVMLCTIPSFLIAIFVKIDPEFGKKKAE